MPLPTHPSTQWQQETEHGKPRTANPWILLLLLISHTRENSPAESYSPYAAFTAL